MVEQGDYLFKIVTIGDSGVGKTSLMLRFCENQFVNSSNTLLSGFKTRDIILNGKTVRFQIWDTAGQERFRALAASYYRGAQGFFVVFDVTNRSSFDSVSNWINEINRNGTENSATIIIGAKADLEHSRQVTYGDAKIFADQNHMSYIEVSSLTGQNVEEAFTLIAKEIIFKQN